MIIRLIKASIKEFIEDTNPYYEGSILENPDIVSNIAYYIELDILEKYKLVKKVR